MTHSTLSLWLPRILGLAVSGFIALFALNAFRAGRPLAEGLPDFAMHLVPAALLFAVVALAWRRPWIGA